LYPKDALALDANVKPNGDGFCGITLTHNVKDKQEVDRILALAKKSGTKISKPAKNTFWGGYSSYFSDLDGYLWEVDWNPHFCIE